MLHFIVNERSSSGKAASVWAEIKEHLDSQKIEYAYRVTERQGYATEIASQLCANNDGEVSIVVVGGDGTINETINGITDFERVRFSVIPTGSGNDFARGMGLKGTVKEHIERVINSKDDSKIDLGLVKYKGCEQGRYFAISSGVGMDALVCKKAETSKVKKILNKIHLGKLTYLIITIQSLFSMDTSDMKSKFDGDRKLKLNKLIFAAFMNFEAEGGGVPMAPRADAMDGKLSVCVCSDVSKLGALCRLPLLVMRKHENLKCFKMIECEDGKMQLEKPMALHADGEYLGDVDVVEYKCEKSKLRFMI